MRLDPNVFRAYDIRGVVPDQIDEAGAEQIARAFVAYRGHPARIVVGHDVRVSSAALHAAACEGIVRSGSGVVDIGRVSTDEFYFACGHLGLPGMMVTASHNPPQYNGFKLVEEIPRLTMASRFKPWVLERTYADAPARGAVERHRVADEFDALMLSLVPPETLKAGLRVAVDSSNGALGPVWERLAPRLPVEIEPLFFEPDGRFPNHGNDIVQPENQEPLRQHVTRSGSDLGLIFDPDGDRCLAVDDSGRSVAGDFLTALLAVTRLQHAPGSTIVYDVRCSEAVPDLVTAAGGRPFVWKPGHVYLKPKMQEFDAVFGGELSGHMYFKEFWFSDSGVLAGLTLMEYVSRATAPLSAEVDRLRDTYHLSGEINLTVPDTAAVLDEIRRTYTGGRMSEMSGVGVWYDDWKFVVRPSDNEPLLRLTVEARSAEQLEARRDELLEFIRNASRAHVP